MHAATAAAVMLQVKLYGFCSQQDKVCMVMELARSALSSLLYDKTFQYCGLRGGLNMPEDIRAAMLLDVARGMQQL
jgi:hypothetical protein